MTTTAKPKRAGRSGDTQALPVEGVQDVASQVRRDIESQGHIGDRVRLATKISVDVGRRIDLGIRRYGRPLETFNGRDALVDAYEEALDLTNYLCQRTLEQNHDAKARLLYWNAVALVFGIAELLP